ncbi:PTS sugar transporter subunit IIB [Tepidanaerobacter sp. GT38]|uniref:PTS sugar transporter subunit IIB n=1 Tax=Tepidanaerobacter sp. GT38 TaxID=2722793 RepID=UPI001F383B41|nr:PTS sugar transporter subunit IIB [Tepidanaerobacter sp. GT38]
MKKKVIFVCATGIATSTAATERVVEYCKERGIDIDFQQSNVASLPSLDGTADLIVSTTNVPFQMKTPVVNALPIITGIGEEEVLEQILKILGR